MKTATTCTKKTHPSTEAIIEWWRANSDDGMHGNAVSFCYGADILKPADEDDEDWGRLVLECVSPQGFRFVVLCEKADCLAADELREYLLRVGQFVEAHVALPPPGNHNEFDMTGPPSLEYPEEAGLDGCPRDHFIEQAKEYYGEAFDAATIPSMMLASALEDDVFALTAALKSAEAASA